MTTPDIDSGNNKTKIKFPIIDSHIHLYAESHLPNLAWTSTLPKSHILNRQNSVDEYKTAISTSTHGNNLQGFIFLETDQRSHISPTTPPGWKYALQEISILSRIAHGTPLPNASEGHTPLDSKLLLGIIPWAPIPLGPEGLESYIEEVRNECIDERTFRLVKGFRYLLQDKPAGTMLEKEFVEGVKWLGDRDYLFELGVDARSGGMWQLREAVEMVGLVYGNDGGGDRDGDGKGRESKGTKVVINHLCKPNLHLSIESKDDGGEGGKEEDEQEKDEDFIQWAKYINQLAAYPRTYMKLSGLFSELPSDWQYFDDEDNDDNNNINSSTTTTLPKLIYHLKPWVEVVFNAFGPQRIMFGSDWPVCQAGGPGTKSWGLWCDVVAAVLDDLGLGDDEKGMIWAGTAREVYGID